MTTLRAEQITQPLCFHGEGPVWAPSWGGLRWVDQLAGDVMHLDTAGAVHRHHVGPHVAALRPWHGGGAVVALDRRFGRLTAQALDAHDGLAEPVTPMLWDDPAVRFNEGDVDPQGRFWCGTMHADEVPGAAALHRLDPGGRVVTLLEGRTISNGLAWAADGSHGFYNDSGDPHVYRFEHPRGDDPPVLSRWCTVEEGAGVPDGLCVDAEGALWVALWGGGAVRRYAPDGSLDRVVPVPAPLVTACTFGGDDLATLFVTTSRKGPEAAGHDASGALFAVAGAGRGLPARAFASPA